MTEAKPQKTDSPATDPGLTTQGKEVALSDIAYGEREAALNEAFDYRGDVTLQLKDGSKVEGYVFDRRGSGADAIVRIWPTGSDERRNISYDDIARLAFSGRDTAEGKSWETWTTKYYEKKARGEEASIYSEEH